jgi:hypothetical protein
LLEQVSGNARADGFKRGGVEAAVDHAQCHHAVLIAARCRAAFILGVAQLQQCVFSTHAGGHRVAFGDLRGLKLCGQCVDDVHAFSS